MKYDDILIELGEFGKYQKRIYFLISLPIVFGAFDSISGVFTQNTPKHRCAIPGLENDTYLTQGVHHSTLVNRSIPWDDGDLSSCKMFGDSDWSKVNRSEVECQRYVYDQSVFQSTITTQLNLICQNRELVTHLTMVFFAGKLVGSILSGIVSDLIGRKKTYLITLVIQTGSTIGLAFVSNYPAYAALRFLIGASSVGANLCLYVIGVELVGPNKRSSAGVALWFLWCVGLFLLGLFAYFIRDWKTLQLVMAFPRVVFFSYWWLIPESTRWLISKGRYDEARVIIDKAAKVNKVELSAKASNLENIEKEERERFWHIFTSPTLVLRTGIIFLNWSIVSMVYYGLSLNVGSLVGDIFVNYQIGNVLELLSYIVIIPLLDKIGRRMSHFSMMLLGGLACVGTMFPVMFGDSSVQWITVVLSMLGRFGATTAYAAIYVFSAELFPTKMRQTAMGASSLCARIGGMISPYVADLGNVITGNWSKALPLIVFGGLTVFAGVISLFLPETNNKQMPESLADAIAFGRSDKKTKYHMDNKSSEATNEKAYPLHFIDISEKAANLK